MDKYRLLSRLIPSFSNRWVHLDTVSRQIIGDIQETQFSCSKMQAHVHLKNAFPGGIGNRRIRFGYNLWFASHPSVGSSYGTNKPPLRPLPFHNSRKSENRVSKSKIEFPARRVAEFYHRTDHEHTTEPRRLGHTLGIELESYYSCVAELDASGVPRPS